MLVTSVEIYCSGEVLSGPSFPCFFTILETLVTYWIPHSIWQVPPQLSRGSTCHIWTWFNITLEGPEDRHLHNSSFGGHIPLAQTPWGLTGRARLQAGAHRAVIAVNPSFNSLGIDSRNEDLNYNAAKWSQSVMENLMNRAPVPPTHDAVRALERE